MTAAKYVPVKPREHDPRCRRKSPYGPSLDIARCARCKALAERLHMDVSPGAVARRWRP